MVGDPFRDHALSGGYKALWLIFLIFVPFLTVLAYLIFRGGGIAERQARSAAGAQDATEYYITSVAGQSPADEIARAKSLLDAGTISQVEFDSQAEFHS